MFSPGKNAFCENARALFAGPANPSVKCKFSEPNVEKGIDPARVYKRLPRMFLHPRKPSSITCVTHFFANPGAQFAEPINAGGNAYVFGHKGQKRQFVCTLRPRF